MGSGPSLALTVCPLTGVPFVDPIVAGDGNTYTRKAILEWERFWKDRRGEVLSPLTRTLFTTKMVVRSDLDAQSLLDDATRSYEKAAKSKPRYSTCRESDARTLAGQVTSIHQMNQVYAVLDSYSDLLSAVTAAWQPPTLIVLGEEGSGKSSLLERILMMPLFPHGRGICTQVCTKVCLRHTQQASTPRLEIIDADSGINFYGPYLIAAENGYLDVEAEMKRLVKEEQDALKMAASEKKAEGRAGSKASNASEEQVMLNMCTSRIIVIHIDGPHLPSIDLLDLPGILHQPPEAAATSRALITSQLQKHIKRALFLTTVPASRTYASSAAMELIEAYEVQSRTLGVFTQCDEAPAHIRNRLDSALKMGITPKQPKKQNFHGWVSVVSAAKVEVTADEKQKLSHGNLLRLQEQAKAEVSFFEYEGLADLVDKGYAGTEALLNRLSELNIRYLLKTWAPQTLWRLDLEHKRLRFELATLGPPYATSRDELSAVRKGVAAAAKSLLDAHATDIAGIVAKEVMAPLEQEILRLLGDEFVSSMEEQNSSWQRWEGLLNAACSYAIGSARKCILQWVKSTLEHQEPLPLWPSEAAEQLVDSQLFVPARYSKFINAVTKLVEGLLSPWKSKLSSGMKDCVKQVFDVGSPWVKNRLRLAANPPQVRVHFAAADVVGVLFSALLRNDLCAKALVAKVIAGLDEVAADLQEWPDFGYAKRESLQAQVAKITSTQADLLKMLGRSPEGLGFLNEISLAHCSCSGVGIHCAWRTLKVRFTLTVRGHDGAKLERSMPEEHPFDVSVHGLNALDSESSNFVLNVPVLDNGDGTQTVEYTIPENYAYEDSVTLSSPSCKMELRVNLHGHPIKGSPFQLIVSDEPVWTPARTLAHGEVGAGELRSPAGLAVYGEHVYVADSDSSGLKIYDSSGFVRTLGGDGGLTFAKPWGIAVDEDSVYVVESGADCIKVVGKEGNVVLQQFGSTGKELGQFSNPCGMCLDGSCAYIADCGNHRVQVLRRKRGESFAASTSFGTEGTYDGQFQNPCGLDVDDSTIHVCDRDNYRVQVFSKFDLSFLFTYGSIGTGPGELWTPYSVALGGPFAYVSDFGNNRIQVFDKSDGRFITTFGSRGRAEGFLRQPGSLFITGESFYVSERGNGRVQVFNIDSFSTGSPGVATVK